MEISTDISKAIDGKNGDVDVMEQSFAVGKSPPKNVDIVSEKVSGAGGLGEGTPKVCPQITSYFKEDITKFVGRIHIISIGLVTHS